MIKTSIRAEEWHLRGDEHPLKWAFARAAELGFDGLEVCPSTGRGSFSANMSPETRKGIKELSEQYKVAVFSLCAEWAWEYSIFFPTYKGWGAGVEYLAEDAKLAQEVGADTILVHLGATKGSWEDCRALLTDVAAAGKEYGVKFGFEANIWAAQQGFGGLDSLIRMVDEVASPYFGVYLHNSYPRAGLPLEQEVATARSRLVRTMHSSSLVDGRVRIDWGKASAAIKQHLPDCVYTFEVEWDEAEENKKAMDKIIKKYW